MTDRQFKLLLANQQAIMQALSQVPGVSAKSSGLAEQLAMTKFMLRDA